MKTHQNQQLVFGFVQTELGLDRQTVGLVAFRCTAIFLALSLLFVTGFCMPYHFGAHGMAPWQKLWRFVYIPSFYYFLCCHQGQGVCVVSGGGRSDEPFLHATSTTLLILHTLTALPLFIPSSAYS